MPSLKLPSFPALVVVLPNLSQSFLITDYGHSDRAYCDELVAIHACPRCSQWRLPLCFELARAAYLSQCAPNGTITVTVLAPLTNFVLLRLIASPVLCPLLELGEPLSSR